MIAPEFSRNLSRVWHARSCSALPLRDLQLFGGIDQTSKLGIVSDRVHVRIALDELELVEAGTQRASEQFERLGFVGAGITMSGELRVKSGQLVQHERRLLIAQTFGRIALGLIDFAGAGEINAASGPRLDEAWIILEQRVEHREAGSSRPPVPLLCFAARRDNAG
jgi:hypothetical protein